MEIGVSSSASLRPRASCSRSLRARASTDIGVSVREQLCITSGQHSVGHQFSRENKKLTHLNMRMAHDLEGRNGWVGSRILLWGNKVDPPPMSVSAARRI